MLRSYRPSGRRCDLTAVRRGGLALVRQALVFVGYLSSLWLPTRADPPPAFALAAELTWSPVYVGDPLRVRVYLSSPRVLEESLDTVREFERFPDQKPAGVQPGPSVSLPEAWPTGLSLRLQRVLPDGTRSAVIAPSDWPGFLRPQIGLPADAPRASTVRSREWLVPAETAALIQGRYELEATWNGTGQAPAEQLPDGGVVTAALVGFEVTSIRGDPGPPGSSEAVRQADHLGRLAFAAAVRGDPAETRRLAAAALQLDPASARPDRLETRLLVARSALNQGDFAASREALRQLALWPGTDPLGEIQEAALTRLETLAPRLRLLSTMTLPGRVRLAFTALHGERYVTWQSTDLRAWSPVSTNLAITNWITLPDQSTSLDGPRFYRVEAAP